MEDGRCIVNLI